MGMIGAHSELAIVENMMTGLLIARVGSYLDRCANRTHHELHDSAVARYLPVAALSVELDQHVTKQAAPEHLGTFAVRERVPGIGNSFNRRIDMRAAIVVALSVCGLFFSACLADQKGSVDDVGTKVTINGDEVSMSRPGAPT